MNATAPIEVERNLRLTEQVMRFMIMRLDESLPVPAQPAAPAEAAAAPLAS